MTEERHQKSLEIPLPARVPLIPWTGSDFIILAEKLNGNSRKHTQLALTPIRPHFDEKGFPKLSSPTVSKTRKNRYELIVYRAYIDPSYVSRHVSYADPDGILLLARMFGVAAVGNLQEGDSVLFDLKQDPYFEDEVTIAATDFQDGEQAIGIIGSPMPSKRGDAMRARVNRWAAAFLVTDEEWSSAIGPALRTELQASKNPDTNTVNATATHILAKALNIPEDIVAYRKNASPEEKQQAKAWRSLLE